MTPQTLGLWPLAFGMRKALEPKGRRSKAQGRLCAALVALVFVAVPPALAQSRCDRACLISISDTYIDALVAKDPSKAPLAANLKYTENGQRLRVGDGFWNSVAGKGTYK